MTFFFVWKWSGGNSIIVQAFSSALLQMFKHFWSDNIPAKKMDHFFFLFSFYLFIYPSIH